TIASHCLAALAGSRVAWQIPHPQRLQQSAGHAQKTNLQRQGKLEGGRSTLVINDASFRLGIRKERFDLEAAQVTRQRASTQIRGLPVVHVLPPDGRHNTPLETANSKCLTHLEKTASSARISDRK